MFHISVQRQPHVGMLKGADSSLRGVGHESGLKIPLTYFNRLENSRGKKRQPFNKESEQFSNESGFNNNT